MDGEMECRCRIQGKMVPIPDYGELSGDDEDEWRSLPVCFLSLGKSCVDAHMN